MKQPIRSFLLAVVVLVLGASSASAQSAVNAFVFTVYGGLFFPSNRQFTQTYNANSDFIYGFGICLPVSEGAFLDVNEGFFNEHVTLDAATQAGQHLEERFIHAGVLLKSKVSSLSYARFLIGPNYVTVKQTSTLPKTPDKTIEAEKKIGWYVGLGMEQAFPDGRASVFIDAMYDYRRSHTVGLEGDFGGIRLVAGAHFFLF